MEEARVEIRNLRREAADDLKKEERDGDVGDGRARRELEQLQKTTDRLRRRGRPRRRRQGAGGPRGLVARAPLAIGRPTRRRWRTGPTSAADEQPTPPTASAPDRRRTPQPRRHCAPPSDLPRHVAIIMDGNRRWARARGVSELEGHAAGVEAIRELLRHAVRRGVPVLTLYAFSRENWARSDDEVVGLFGLLEQAIRERDRRAPRAGRPGPAARPPRGAARRDPRRSIESARSARPPAATRLQPQHRLQLRRPDRARRRRSAGSPRAASPPEEIDEADDRRRRCTRPACPTPTS